MYRNHVYTPEQVLPQRASMLFIDEIIEWSQNSIKALVYHCKGNAFTNHLGVTPSLAGLEYMCQAAAAHAGIMQIEQQDSIRVSFFLGTREISFNQAFYAKNEILLISAELEFATQAKIGVYNCQIDSLELDKKLISSAKIKAIMT